MTGECWMAVPGFEKFYAVSDRGQLLSYHYMATLDLNVDTDGYKIGRLFSDTVKRFPFRLHQLVAKVFIGPRPEGMTVNHKDGNKTNNHASNLEYLSSGDNTRHAQALGLRKILRGEECSRSILRESDIIMAKAEKSIGIPVSFTARKHGLPYRALLDAVAGRNWSHLS